MESENRSQRRQLSGGQQIIFPARVDRNVTGVRRRFYMLGRQGKPAAAR
jgi:hypothetical protein